MTFNAANFSDLSAGQLYEILKSRMEVFMLEQQIHCLDMDNVDYRSRHCFLEDRGRVLAYLRAFYGEDRNSLQIGRVLTLHHGQGLGRELMCRTLEDLRENMPCQKLVLHSQTHAMGFYEKFGFRTVSEEFLEEGIPHVTMELEMA